MAEQVAVQNGPQQQSQLPTTHSTPQSNTTNSNSNNNNNNSNNDINTKNKKRSPEIQLTGVGGAGTVLMRERSFVKSSNNANKRRSLAFHPQQNQIRGGKPTMEIYRPPKLNYNLQHSSSSSIIFPSPGNHLIQHSKSGANIQQMHHHLAAAAVLQQQQQQQQQQQRFSTGGQTISATANFGNLGQRAILVSHPIPMSPVAATLQQTQFPIVNSQTNGNVLHAHHRVKFAPEPQISKVPNHQNNNLIMNQNHQNYYALNNAAAYQYNANSTAGILPQLQRSKSLSSADALTRGIATLGLGVANETNDIGQFAPDIQQLIDKALQDPNKLSARNLMELAIQVMQRAVEGRRYALPISRLCIQIISKEAKETFLEALLNTCRQWYQEREKILYPGQSMKNSSRSRFTAFMAFLTEMFCQLKRRQLQLRTQCDGAPPPLVLLTLLSKCCEDCVKPPVRSLSEIECLFFVLTCIGRDLEIHLSQQLETLLSLVRDAFLNASASAPAIRRTLLQLIELHASRWQLPGNTVLYYYPSTK
ncbi:probable serine/threonine-protein kinase tsuA isoform X2 [Condylostylus longicornis]|uniref:probable serine/threonine-protein kinase tsuA isoform X2 n=1 Tax=Condylostylus longicornis TaxID=2530218 RepID=UPI00244DA955|nr:probable serine/threonine-protein kinase tsuA isoform X2 [Condylostylus longicornis]